MATNIWGEFNFSESKEDNAYDILIPICEELAEVTANELKMEINSVVAYLEQEPDRLVSLYMIYIVAPNLGSFRRKIITIIEFKDTGIFPVEVFSHLDQEKFEKVDKKDLLTTIKQILTKPVVKGSIESLYAESRILSKNKEPDLTGNLTDRTA